MEPELTPHTSDSTGIVVFNLRLLAVVATVVIALITTAVFIISNQSIYDELEITLILIAVVLFLFLCHALNSGATIVGRPLFPKLKFVDPAGIEGLPVDALDLGGTIGSILAWFVLTVLFAFLFAFVATALWSALVLLVFALYWLFYRALRTVLVHAKKCKGNLSLSISYSLLYTVLYTGWCFVIVWLREFWVATG